MGKRAYDILRGYVSTEWERIKDVERDLAERELKSSNDFSYTLPLPKPDSVPIASEEQWDKKAYARRLLGVSEGCSFSDLRKAFLRLNKRSDPGNFPAGSSEAEKASDIQRRVNWAYGVLTEDMNVTEQRFRTLELD